MSLPVECGPHGEGKRSLRQSFQTATHHLLEMRGTEDVHRVGASATTYDLAPSKSNDRRQSARGDDHQPRVPKSYKYCGKLHELRRNFVQRTIRGARNATNYTILQECVIALRMAATARLGRSANSCIPTMNRTLRIFLLYTRTNLSKTRKNCLRD
jgi:hypothetical protein